MLKTLTIYLTISTQKINALLMAFCDCVHCRTVVWAVIKIFVQTWLAKTQRKERVFIYTTQQEERPVEIKKY